MTRVRWYIGRLWIALDPVLAGSVVTGLFAAALHWGVTLPGEAALAQQRAAAGQAHVVAAQAARTISGARSDQAALAQAQARFPLADNQSVTGALIGLQAMAAKEGLILERGTYQLSSDQAGALKHYSISLPVKGSYPALRVMIRQLGRELPHVVLDSVQIRRAGRSEPVVDAQLEFSAYFRVAP